MVLLLIELFDELVFGVWGAATPLVRADLGLSYAQIGLLLSVPALLAGVIEPAFGILADSGRRRSLIAIGGFTFAAGLVAMAWAMSFPVLLIAVVAIWPASGAFVSLSQAALMDLQPEVRERNMARWVLVGSLGVVTGPLLIAAAAAAGISWRLPVLALAAAGAALAVLTLRPALRNVHPQDGAPPFAEALREAILQLRNAEVLRWLFVLQVGDLMLDVLLSYIALYFVDVVGFSAAKAGAAVAAMTVAGLMGEAGMLVLLKKTSGLRYLRVSAVLVLPGFAAFLVLPSPLAKIVALAIVGILTSGWYSVANARLYEALPGRSGTAVALSSAAAVFHALLPLAVALLAGRFGLGRALWVCLLAPTVLLALVPGSGPGRLTGPATGHTVR